MNSEEATERGASCAECGNHAELDGENAGIRAGRLLCRKCADRDVVYVVECVDCDWEYAFRDFMFNWYHTRQRVQQEGNSHEDRNRVFEDEKHETVWRRVYDLSEAVVDRAE